MATENSTHSSAEFRDIFILVVDDTPDDLERLAGLLTEKGYTVEAATNSKRALQSIATIRPDLVLLDVKLPRLDGQLLCRYLQKNPATADVPILYTCSPEDLDEQVSPCEAGAFDFVIKPFRPRELLIRVRNHIALRRARHHLEALLRESADESTSKTERLAHADEALNKSQRNHQEIFNATNEAIFHQALEHASESIIITDGKGRIRYANPYYQRLSGYNEEELHGRTVRLLDPAGGDPETVEQIWRVLNQGETWSGSCVEQARDGSAIEQELTLTPILTADGRPCNLVLIKRDVTERREVEGRLFQERKMAAIRGLAGGIGHDFNNLLAAILGYSEMTRDSLAEGSTPRRNLDNVIAAADRARGLVRQLLSFSQQDDHGRFPINIHSLIKEALKKVGESAPSTVEIHQDIDPRCGIILADPAGIQTLVTCLCENAVEAMAGQEGVLTVALREERVEDDPFLARVKPRSAVYLKLQVSDTGRGMSTELLERIFEPYFSTKAARAGKGMGLTMVHAIVSRHEGLINVSSEAGFGAVFSIYLPLIEELRGTESPAESPRARGGERILLVDDEEILTLLEQKTLERLGYRVTAMTDSAETLRTFQETPHDYDLLITDQSMPNLTGTELAREVLTIRPDMPIILCTGFSESVDEEHALALGIDAFLLKPVTIQRFSSIVRSVLDARQQGAASGPNP